MDVNEQLQGQLNSMKKDLRWASVDIPPGAVTAPVFEGSTVAFGASPVISGAAVATLGSSRPRDASGCIHSIHPMHSVGITCVILIPLPGVSRQVLSLPSENGNRGSEQVRLAHTTL